MNALTLTAGLSVMCLALVEFSDAAEGPRIGSPRNSSRAIRAQSRRDDGPVNPAKQAHDRAVVHQSQGRFADAESAFLEAIAIRKDRKELVPLAEEQSYLGHLYMQTGRWDEALAVLAPCLEYREQALGTNHLHTATARNLLGQLFLKFGVRSKDPEHRRSCYRYAQGQFALCEQAYRNASLTALPNRDAWLAMCLNNQGLAAAYLQESDKALTFYTRSIEAWKKLGNSRDEEQYQQALGNLALLHKGLGQYDKARPLLEEALKVRRQKLPADHPLVALSLDSLAVLHAERAVRHNLQNDWELAAKYFSEARQSVRRRMETDLLSLDEAQQTSVLSNYHATGLDSAASLARFAPPGVSAIPAAAEWVINGKGTGIEALSGRELLARQNGAAGPDAALGGLREVRSQMSQWAMSLPSKEKPDDHRNEMAKLRREESRILRELALAAKANRSAWIELSAVRARIPEGAVLVEILRHTPFDFSTPGWNPDRKLLPARYSAWIIPAAGADAVKFVDLGEAGPIDALVRQIRDELDQSAAPEGKLRQHGEAEAHRMLNVPFQQLANFVWNPLAPHVAGSKELILSPDGDLWLLPWAAMPVGNDRMLVENAVVRFVHSGRDLLRTFPKVAADPPVIVAGPDFDLGTEPKATAIRALDARAALVVEPARGDALLPLATPLDGAAAEAVAVRVSMTNAAGGIAPQELTGPRALETAVKRLKNPSILLFSTHGFTLDASDDGTSPMLRTGLLLAGVNHRAIVAGDDGILTGLEILGLDLTGTELVVLSACDTGKGVIRNAEGVSGLRQAFQLAGAHSVVATLWQIPDGESTALMESFFQNLAAGKSKPEALREAQLERIAARRKKHAAANPYFWAAWTVTGQ